MKKKDDSFSLSEKYRSQNYALSKEEKEVYLTVRMPATASAIEFVFRELLVRAPDEPINSLTDLGAGPGSSLKALESLNLVLDDIDLVERDDRLIDLGKTTFPNFAKNYKQHDITTDLPLSPKDVVLLSYSFNEIPANKQMSVLENAFRLSKKFVILVEPGTPRGYANMLKARDSGIKAGLHVVAPCPHDKACPLKEGDWCHFSVRLNRSAEHRQLKHGELSYEDEKFSYVILSKKPYPRCKARILRHPMHRKGLVEMRLCMEEGIQNKIFTKSNNENFKIIKKKEWGEEIPLTFN